MEKLVIEGGVPLRGELKISGAKNAALPLIAATLLAPGTHVLYNVPNLRDTRTLLKLMEELGCSYEYNGSLLKVDTTIINHSEASYELVKTMRASVLVLGPLLARTGAAKVSLPGGCAIGARPIDFHIKGFEHLGAVCKLESGYVEASISDRLVGNTVYFDIPSVTATENLLMAATLAKGITVIKNAAREPEIGNLIDMLISMGAEIEGKDSDTITVHGVRHLHAAENRIIPDRIETGTYLIAIGATGGEATINNCCPAHLPALLEKLREAGFTILEDKHSLHIRSPRSAEGKLHVMHTNITTRPYPGYPTDLQAQFMALMAISDGASIINETIFENRFMHVAELCRMGADIKVDGKTAFVSGKGDTGLLGAPVMATDLRASSSLVIAGLAASGKTCISRIYHLERGYENLVEKLTGLGARVWKER